MISAQDWWNVFIGYNQNLYPFQWIVMGVAFALIAWLILRPSNMASKSVMMFLSLANIWNGLMFFIVIGTGLPSPLRFIQGGLFIAIGLLLGMDTLRGKTKLQLPGKGIQRNVTVLLLLIVACYPVIGLLRGHSVYQLVYPGTLPCATTSLSLILLSTALPKTNKPAYMLLLVWAITFAPLVQSPVFQVYEAAIMFIVGIYALVQFIRAQVTARKEKNTQIHS